MEKSKQHCYSTRRNKVAKLEENENPGKKSPALSKIKNLESPAIAKYMMISGYASPPCRHPITLSQQNENEIVWDLTSPAADARKYQVLSSDKKTSTPNQTPTRKRELRPRVALCKKNIALVQDKNDGLVNELAVLNDLVNEQAQIIMTPPRSVKGSVTDNNELPIEENKSLLPTCMNTSDAFDDDSFFSESILLSTQALEEEAIGCNPTPSKKMKNESIMTPSSPQTNSSNNFVFNQQSPEGSVIRRSFDLDSEELILNENLNKFASPKSATAKFPVPDQRALPLGSQSQILNNSITCAKQSSSVNIGKPSKFNPTGKIISKLQVNEIKPIKMSVPLRTSQTPKLANATDCNRNVCHDSTRSHISASPVRQNSVPLKQLTGKSYGIGIKRILDDAVEKKKPKEVHQTSFVNPPPKFKPQDPFDDDDDYDLLCAMSAIAEEVESKYVPVTCKTELDDDVDFQPDVLAFISQIETQAIKTEKSTAELLEEKRQAAIRKREQRLMSRR